MAAAQKALVVTLMILLLSWLGQLSFGHSAVNRDEDFQVYYTAALMVRQHHSAQLYAAVTGGNPQLRYAAAGSAFRDTADAAGIKSVELYVYPPLLADALVPLSQLPVHTAAGAWRVWNVILLCCSALAMAHLLAMAHPLKSVTRAAALILLGLISFFPIRESLDLGQISITLLALWTFAALCYGSDRKLWAAVLLALMTAIKITPVFVILLFLIWRDWRSLRAYVGTLLALTLAMCLINGPHVVATYFLDVMPSMSAGVPVLRNKSLPTLVHWLYLGRALTDQEFLNSRLPHLIVLAGKAVALLFLGWCVLQVYWRRTVASISDRVLIVALFAIVANLVSPVSWRHAYAICALPLVLLWGEATLHRDKKTHWNIPLLFATVAMGSLLFEGPASRIPGVVGMLLGAVFPIAAAVLVAVRLRSLSRGSADSSVRLSGSKLESGVSLWR